MFNEGPDYAAAGVFTRNQVKAAPVLWTQQVLTTGRLRAVILNSGGANACTGPAGFADTHATAEAVAAAARRSARSSAAGSAAASVVSTHSMVANDGASMPAPLAMPPTVQLS
ncbi:Probable arginine biosynthesis bifunctional protein ArgJ [Mycobacterium tuberculosis]|nr:Probable arginine biosynthesis bifunctional protein ArgJ [Mycobacterium tuberculosis]